jgi:hypothetical protein
MAMESVVATLPGGETEVSVRSDVDVVGRAVQLGRGMMEQVSAQLFKQFAACVRTTLEAEAARSAEPVAGASGSAAATLEAAAAAPARVQPSGARATADAPPSAGATALAHKAEPIRALPLVFRALLAALGAFLRRVLGGQPRR